MLIRNPTARSDSRLLIFAILVFCGGCVLIQRLYELQVKEGKKYAENLRSQSTVPVLLPPARGGIVDRNGVGLAENRASIDIDLYLREMVGSYARSQKGGHVPKTAVPGFPKREMPDVPRIVQETAGDVIKALNLKAKFSDRDLLRHYYQKPNIPFQIASGLDFETLSKFAEHSFNTPGVEQSARPVRTYNYGALASHILGYVGPPEEVTDAYFVPDSVGRDGLERSFDSYLQGVPGGKILRKSNLGYILGVEAVRQPTVGGTIYLAMDARIEQIVEQTMRAGGVGRGACVVMDPNNGDILAMVSVPDYDLNSFVPKVDKAEWQRLNSDSTRPLLNRVLNGYATGSTFKPITAMAALKNKNAKFTPETTINSPAAIWLAGRWWKDWPNNPGEGEITLMTALQWSTNTFFYQLGVRTGIDSIQQMARLVGFGQKLLVDEDGNPLVNGETPGVVPGPDLFQAEGEKKLKAWREKRKEDPKGKWPVPIIERWSDGHTANTSIGQGFVSVSPLQLCNMVCAIANGGTVRFPRLVLKVISQRNGVSEVVREFSERVKGNLGLTTEQLGAVRKGMRMVVDGGTGKRAEVPGFPVAGKTGTAQFKTRINGSDVNDYRTWFIGFAPYDKPRYALAILVEGGVSGGSTCAPIAHEILRRISEMEKGTPVEMVYLPPAIGHYMGVTALLPTSPGFTAAAQPPPAGAPGDFSQPSEVPQETDDVKPNSMMEEANRRRNR